jgi:hypothetical protein
VIGKALRSVIIVSWTKALTEPDRPPAGSSQPNTRAKIVSICLK